MKLEDIKKVVILGGGTMGPGIVQTFATFGYETVCWSRREETIAKAIKVVRKNLETFVKHNRIKAGDIEPIMSRITFTTDFDKAVENGDFFIESIVENMDAKKEIYEKLDKAIKADAIITSNTSYLNIYGVVPQARKANTIIAHWFAPPHILPLVECVRGPETSDDTVNTVVAFMQKVDKTPIVMQKFVPGFVINRFLRIMGREAFFLLDHGYITADQLDLAIKASIAPRMVLLGVVQRYDFTGLDLSAKNLENPDYLEPEFTNHPTSLYELVEKGDYGVKTGKGFYDYSSRELQDILADRDDMLLDIFDSVKDYIKPNSLS